MKITVSALKQLIREAMEDLDPMELERQAQGSEGMSKEDLFQLYIDMYKEMYNLKPRWLRLDDVSEDQLRAMIKDLESRYEQEIEQRQKEDKEAEEYYKELQKEREEEDKAKAELAALGYQGQDLENLPKSSGMGHRLEESIKLLVAEVLEEAKKKKAKTYKGKSMRKGGGGSFAKLVDKIKSSGKSEESANAIVAAAGRDKYGAKEMARMAKAGKKRAAKKK